ncbi:HGGxSTG domain-containing protein [Tahibacter harae]|uniref:HGGxSTG domain-containing protein n=1 Tax=Tahibacter harae TaxID=2963937 RepID=UPI0034E08D6F
MQRRSSRPPCGAHTRRGTPCQGGKIPGRKRCKWHGGLSTGPRTEAGKRKSLQNLVQFRTANPGAAARGDQPEEGCC